MAALRGHAVVVDPEVFLTLHVRHPHRCGGAARENYRSRGRECRRAKSPEGLFTALSVNGIAAARIQVSNRQPTMRFRRHS
jgi:hypothetical protein